MPAISVIVSNHNGAGFIDACLEQLAAQSFQDFDILVVDDASTDDSVRILRGWQQREPRLRLIVNERNLGLPALTRNVALDSGLACGDAILFLDGDDVIEPTMLETLWQLLQGRDAGTSPAAPAAPAAGPADVAICGYDRVERESGERIALEMQDFPPLLEAPFEGDGLCYVNTAVWNKLWRRELIEGLRFPAIRVGEEIGFAWAAYQRARRIAFTPQPLIHYQVKAGSVIASTRRDDMDALADELGRLHAAASTSAARDQIGLLAFLHLGLSMALRAASDPRIDLAAYCRDTAIRFERDYDCFARNPLLTWRTLRRRGLKGHAIWLALRAYHLHLMAPLLRAARKLGLLGRIWW